MTSEQFRALLQALAHKAGLADASGLVDQGRVRVGEWNTTLEHQPAYDENLVQIRILLGKLTPGGMTQALLQANYQHGYGGECVFSVYPEADEVVATMKLKLQDSMSAQDFWQELSDLVRHAAGIWEEVLGETQHSQGWMSHDFQTAFAQRA